jgi:eukaryotic-like serine/threonine-protein kinase
MTPERWQRVKSALEQAMALSGEPRAACLQRIGDSDPTLRAEVESLLAADQMAGSRFMATPAPAAVELGDMPGRFVGRRLGPYEMLAQIGSGGMGEVYRAARVDKEYRQQVAIKLVRAGQESSFIASRLRAERQILATFAHPNIARLLDGGTTEEGIPYLVMELIDGQPITQYCDEQRLDTTARLRLFAQVCSAVQYAHQRMVIHRDLKPSNILVTPDGVPKLLDFGIAKILEPGAIGVETDLTVNAFAILTPQYASPEQFTGAAVTAVSDVYCLGVILYELLTGCRPYSVSGACNTPEVAKRVLTLEPRKPSSVVAARSGGDPHSKLCAAREGSAERLSRRLRGDLDNIVMMALRKEPERRYAGAEQLAEDIRRHLQHLPVIARKDTLGYRTSRFVRRHTLGVAAAGLMVAVLLGGIVTTAREARIAEAQRARAEHRFSDVRKLAAALIFDIHDSIRDLPGAERSRHLLIDTSLHYLDSLSQEASGDPGLERELAAAYVRLGDLQGRVLEANEGDYAGAQKSYRHAFALLRAALQQSPASGDARHDMVVTCGKLSDLEWNTGDAAGALEYSRLTVEHSRALAQAHAGEARFQQLLATAELDYGFKLFKIKGDRVAALGNMRPAVEQLARLSAADPRNQWTGRTLALGYGRMAEVLEATEQRAADAAGPQAAHAVGERVADAAGPQAAHAAGERSAYVVGERVADPAGERSAYVVGERVADAAGERAAGPNAQQAANAWPMRLKQQRVLDALVRAAPNNADLAHLHAFAQHDAAATLLRMGRLKEASGVAHSALDAFRALALSDPKIEEYHVDIAIALDDLARIALQGGEPQRALPWVQEAMQQSASVRPVSSAEFRMVRADTQLLLADTEAALLSDTHRSAIQRDHDREDRCRQLGEAAATYRALSATMAQAAQELRHRTAQLDRCQRELTADRL